MTLGPVQMLAIGFGAETEFHGAVLDELDRLTNRGLIRVLDVGLIRKSESGDVVHLQASELTAGEAQEMGQSIKSLLGAGANERIVEQAVELSNSSLMAELTVGVAFDQVDAFVNELNPGESVGVLLFEHVWAKRFGEIVRQSGGVPLLQGFLTPELTMAVGAELEAISEAAMVVEIAEAVQGAVILDTLRTMEEAEELKAAIAADVVRTLVVAGLIEEAAINEVIDVLYAADLIEEVAMLEADAAVAEAEAEIAEARSYLA